MISQILSAFHQAYLQNALCAGLLVSILIAVVGYFIVLRRAAFATHALSQIGFAGAAGAVFLGIEPLVGLIVVALGGAILLGALTARARASDETTALVLVFALGTGALALALAQNYASNVFSLLFGTIVGIDRAEVTLTAGVTIVSLAVLSFISRPLLFATVSRAAARTKRVPVTALDIGFLLIIALTSAVAVPIVGALLVYSLALGPAAAASRLCADPRRTIIVAAAFGAFAVVAGIILAFLTDWPVGFFVSTITTLEYVVARAISVELQKTHLRHQVGSQTCAGDGT